MTPDCLSCIHFKTNEEARCDGYTFGRCAIQPKNARTTGMHLPVSTHSRLVSSGMVCECFELREEAA